MEKQYTYEDCVIIANRMMENIAYDNGAVNRFNEMKYNKRWANKIASKIHIFFNLNPQYMNDEDIEQICNGCNEDNQEKFSKLKGYKELDKVLNEYFEDIKK